MSENEAKLECLRDRVYELYIEKFIECVPDYDVNALEAIAVDLEDGTFREAMELARGYNRKPHDVNFKYHYHQTYLKVVHNIFVNVRNSAIARQKILDGEWKASKVPSMTHRELFPELAEERDKSFVREMSKRIQSDEDKPKTEGFLMCGRCKGKHVDYTQLQTRSGDEGITNHCLCRDCGNRWKFS